MRALCRYRALTAAAVLSLGGWAFAGHGLVMAQTPATPPPPAINVFQRFTTTSAERSLMIPIIQLFREKHYDAAEKVLREAVQRFPDSALFRYNLAAALAREGKTGAAFDSLGDAVRLGFASKAIIARDPDFDSLRAHPRYRALMAEIDAAVAAARKRPPVRIKPALIVQGRAVVDASNTAWDPRNNILLSQFAFEPKAQSKIVQSGDDAVAKLLNDWYRKGEAAGNNGDLYDNRDRGHSRLSAGLLPQVAHIVYGPEAHEAGVDYGVNPGIMFNATTLGNSSTALTNTFAWRSQARLVLTSPDLIGRAFLQYISNALYVYPEHRDHEAGQGDLMPANTPYMLVSQGSSGSDQPFLHAVAAILAAFRPEVKDFLRKRGLVMPTVQMIFRHGQSQVRDDADYLSAKAHPSVFSSKTIDLVRMIKLAHGLEADAVPPLVKLAVVEEDKAKAGVDYFAPASIGENLFDTPSAIARLVRSTRYRRRIVVSAGGTKDPNGRALTFHWVVLRGDAARIKIRTLGKKGEKAEIQIPWHDRRAVPFSPDLTTDRVDIGVFASNGTNISAPAFVSFFYPGDQKRSYDQNGRIRCVDYNDAAFRRRYVDPLLFPARDWRDCYEYDAAGRLTGWNRLAGKTLQRFTRNGEKIVETDDAGRPTRAESVLYALEPTKAGRPKIVQLPIGRFVGYRYQSADDRLGTPGAAEK